MRIIILVIFLALHITSPVQAAEQPVLRIAIDFPYPPFAYNDPETGKLTGFDYDMATALCRVMGRTCEIYPVIFEEIIPGIVAGELDIAVCGVGKNPEREKLVLFSNKYFSSTSIFIELPNTVSVSRKGLAGKKIGVQGKTTQEIFLRETYGDVAAIVPFVQFEELAPALLAGKVDVIFMDGLPGYHLLKSREGATLDIVGDPVSFNKDAYIALNKNLKKEQTAINKAILKLRSTGEYDIISRKYFGFSVY